MFSFNYKVRNWTSISPCSTCTHTFSAIYWEVYIQESSITHLWVSSHDENRYRNSAQAAVKVDWIDKSCGSPSMIIVVFSIRTNEIRIHCTIIIYRYVSKHIFVIKCITAWRCSGSTRCCWNTMSIFRGRSGWNNWRNSMCSTETYFGCPWFGFSSHDPSWRWDKSKIRDRTFPIHMMQAIVAEHPLTHRRWLDVIWSHCLKMRKLTYALSIDKLPVCRSYTSSLPQLHYYVTFHEIPQFIRFLTEIYATEYTSSPPASDCYTLLSRSMRKFTQNVRPLNI